MEGGQQWRKNLHDGFGIRSSEVLSQVEAACILRIPSIAVTAKREALPFDKKFNFIVSDKKKSYIFERGKIKRGVDRNAYASISLEGKDWLRILSGEINFLTLLMESKLRIPSDKFLILTRLGYILQFLS